ncbi:acrylyl-CoA reductase family protein [Paenibacillus macquariensis]|uniref:Quinone oxidoreductase, YhdH/YhfP family n=1 Tax=Paenibacillus macquariensis TaxID=948756 RepID=A0ABY1JZN7_9BACL|nr:acryloyl-CoA reductase [Paenibacillus macquariensis]MEC0091317.1 acryloyl-CoA reductase [Paenibacillus macquariensis]OAB38007.1 quinone oxidoreductase [Paenibacillus macquariensis subsp. macquariensis]SIR04202.1 putative quinone oxidoreductase, YhdH/YhfP family [Paenibacillus macquariensis]
MDKFEAFMIRKDEEGFRSGVETLNIEQLSEGDVVVKVHYSGVNYKDGLANSPEGRIVSSYPFVPGIDMAGSVVESSHPRFQAGDAVLCTGYGLGVSHFGGYSGYVRLSGDWLVSIPSGLTFKEAMGIGTAGFTAGLSVDSLIHNGLSPERGPVLVTGATGGVGSIAIDILATLGYEVVASTGKIESQKDWLYQLGASSVVSREDIIAPAKGILAKERWAAIIDPVGGSNLNGLLKSIQYGGGVALSGLTGGGGFESTVYPFILRGVQLLGIDSVYCPMERRQAVWSKLGAEWKPVKMLEQGITEISLHELPNVLEDILQGGAVGRTVVKFD